MYPTTFIIRTSLLVISFLKFCGDVLYACQTTIFETKKKVPKRLIEKINVFIINCFYLVVGTGFEPVMSLTQRKF